MSRIFGTLILVLLLMTQSGCNQMGETTNPSSEISALGCTNTEINQLSWNSDLQGPPPVSSKLQSDELYPDGVNDTLLRNQKHLKSIKWTQAADLILNSGLTYNNQVVVAVIDTGFDITHPELADHIWQNTDEIAGNSIDDDGNGYVDDINGYDFALNRNNVSPRTDPDYPSELDIHGTAVAGIIAAKSNNGIGVSGVAYNTVKIMPLKVFGYNPGASIGAIAQAIQYAVSNGANIINLSLGTHTEFDVLRTYVDLAVNSGIVVVSSAGNRGSSNLPGFVGYPAGYAIEREGHLSVAATYAASYFPTTYTSGHAVLAEIAAPGSDSRYGDKYDPYGQGILTLAPGGQYTRMHGTSAAAPVVSAAAALAIATYNAKGISTTPAQIERDLRQSGEQYISLDRYTNGCRHLDVEALITGILAQ